MTSKEIHEAIDSLLVSTNADATADILHGINERIDDASSDVNDVTAATRAITGELEGRINAIEKRRALVVQPPLEDPPTYTKA